MLAHPWTADEAPHLVGLLAAWPGLADQDAKTALLDAIENLISD